MLDLSAEIDNSEAIRRFKELQQAAKQTTSSIVTDSDRMDIALRKFGNTLAKIGVGFSLGALVRQIAQTRGEFQQLEVAFTTLLQSKEKADSLMKQMVDLAATTPFDLQGVADGARQLLAYGFAADDITDTLTRLGNVAAGLGLPLERLTYLYGTTAVQGRVYARDMLQFTGSGIPVLQEMAKMYGKTTEEINSMVSAGKIGFEDVRKVIENMTNAGGQFHNLMENQSKTINGLISNLEDAIDFMFNEIGKSQEVVISSVLKGAILLVENYEKVLDVLLPLVAAYGAYKAALIATAAIQKAKATVEAVRLMMMYRKELGLATAAQQAFNVSLKANPLGLALSLLTLIGTAVWRYASGAKDAAENTLGLARANKKASEEIDTETSKLQALQDVVNNANNSYEERRKALNRLKEIVPSYHAELTSEGQLINNNTEALQKYIKEFEKNIRLKAAQEELEEAYRQKRLQEKERSKAQNELKLAESRIPQNVSQMGYGEAGVISTRASFNEVDRAKQKVQDAELEIAKVDKAIQELNNEITHQSNLVEENGSKAIVSAAKNLQDAQDAYDQAVKAWKKAIKQGEDITVVKQKKDDVDTKKKALDKAKKISGVDDKTVKTATKTQQKLSDLLVESELDLQKSRISIIKDGKNKRLAEIDLEYQQTMARINKNRRDSVKNGATGDQLEIFDEQVFLTDRKRINDKGKVYAEYYNEWTKTYTKLGDVFLYEEDRKQKALEKTYQEMRNKADKDFFSGNINQQQYIDLTFRINAAEDKEKFDLEVERYRKYVEERMRIEEEFNEDVGRLRKARKGGKAEEEIEQRKAVKDSELQTLAEELGVTEEGFVSFVDSLIYRGTESLIALIVEAQTELAKLGKDGDPAKRAEQQNRLNAAKKELARRDKKGEQTNAPTKKELKEWAKLQGVLNDVYDTFGEIGEAIGGTAGEAIQLGGEIATSMTQLIGNILQVADSGAMAVQSTSEATSTAIRTVESASVILAIISAALQLAMKIAQLFTKDHELSEDTIKTYEAYMDVTDKLIKKQKDLLDTVTGVQAVMASKEGIETIEKQIEATRELGKAYLASRKRNNHSYGVKMEKWMKGYRTDIENAGFNWDALKGSGRMEGLFDLSASELEQFQKELPLIWSKIDEDAQKYLETIIECSEKMDELGEATNKSLTGFSFDDAKDELLDFLNDMDMTFDDVAENFQSSMMQSINRVVASGLNDRLKSWYDNFSEAMSDDKLSDAEVDSLKKEYESIYADALREREEAYNIAGINPNVDTDKQSAAARGFQGMDQETGNELNGRFTAIQGDVHDIKSSVLQSLVNGTQQLNETINIRDIMIQLHGNVADIRTYTRVLPEMSQTLNAMNRKLADL